jgi:arginyl-tRNA synthetase
LVWRELTDGLAVALAACGLDGPGRIARLELAIPRDPTHGDWTTNLALSLAKEARRSPRAVAEALAAAFPRDPALFESVEVAGPGFLNFRYAPAFIAALPAHIRSAAATFGNSDWGRGERVLVEYVSANPTGPMNIVSARAAAVGSTLTRLLAAAGCPSEGEFYVNDAGNQVDLLGASLAAQFAERIGIPRPLPEGGYRGSYLRDIAAALPEAEARTHLDDPAWFSAQALERMVAWQRGDLSDYGVSFARWFRESELHRSGAVTDTLAELERRGMVYRATRPEEVSAAAAGRAGNTEAPEGEATWIRTARFGDDMDRVVVRANGVPTYLLPDLAYHRDKHARGFRRAINLWGPDHHAYVTTIKAGLAALGIEPEFLEVLIVQQVNLLSGGQPVKMSKRAGEFVSLRDLMDDVGADCAKFFFLMRSTGAHLDFDLDLARTQNDENPAFYVQYAHARIASLLRFAAERGLEPLGPGAAPAAGVALAAAEETALLRKLATFPEIVRGAAATREPHRVPTFLTETAAAFHRFYHVCRIVSDDLPLSRWRLSVADACRQVLANGLALMGVSAPERMERATPAEENA